MPAPPPAPCRRAARRAGCSAAPAPARRRSPAPAARHARGRGAGTAGARRRARPRPARLRRRLQRRSPAARRSGAGPARARLHGEGHVLRAEKLGTSWLIWNVRARPSAGAAVRRQARDVAPVQQRPGRHRARSVPMSWSISSSCRRRSGRSARAVPARDVEADVPCDGERAEALAQAADRRACSWAAPPPRSSAASDQQRAEQQRPVRGEAGEPLLGHDQPRPGRRADSAVMLRPSGRRCPGSP